MNYIVSASDKSYFINVVNLIFSLKNSGNRDFTFIFYDLGITPSQSKKLSKVSEKLSFPIEIKPFDFQQYPDFVKPNMGSYAWKPIIIDLELNASKSTLLYLDSASLIRGDLSKIWKVIEETGLYTPICGSGSLADWTHPQTFSYFEPIEAKTIRNRCGGLCGFDYSKELVRELVGDWKKYALIEDCIIPKGSDRTNHRHDQSIFNILLHQKKYSALSLSKVEVNISSPNPIKEISVRNKLPENFPINLLWFSRIYFRIRAGLDKYINKIKK